MTASTMAGRMFPVVYYRVSRRRSDEYVQTTGWYIQFLDDCDENGEPFLLSLSDGDLYFASQKDAMLASEALYQAGIRTDEQLMALSDDEARRICYGALAW